MADTVNLADEFTPPDTTAAPAHGSSTDLSSEFDPPAREDQHAIVNDAASKAKEWDDEVSKYGEIKAQNLVDKWLGPAVGNFYKAKKAIEESPGTETALAPLVNLPRAPSDLGETSTIPGASTNLPIIAGIYNGLAPIASGFTSPLNIATLGAFGALTKVAQGIGPTATIARNALTAAKLYFASEAAKGAGAAAGEASVTPTVENITGTVAQSVLAATIGHSAATESLPKGETQNANPIKSPTTEVRSNSEPAPSGGQVAEGVASQPEVAAGARSEEVQTTAPKEAVTSPPNDYAEYQQIQARWKELINEGKDLTDPEMQDLFRRNEEVKNRNEGMPPEAPKNVNLANEFEAAPNPDTDEGSVIKDELTKNQAIVPPETPESVQPPEGGITGIKNAIVDEERKARGLPSAMEPAAREFPKVWDEATRKIDNDPEIGARIVTELLDKPRALSDTENAILLQRQIGLQNEFDKVSDRIVNGGEGSTPETMASDRIRLAKLSDDLLDVYNAGKQAGTEQGRGLNARKLLANEDYSLAKMVINRRAVNDGKPLTTEQMAEVQALHDKIAETQKAFDEYRTKAESSAATKTTSTRGASKNVVTKFIADRAAEARARIAARSGRVRSGIDPAELADHVIVGADYIAKGVTKFAEWSGEMIKEFGDAIEPHLQAIFSRSQKAWDELSKARADETRLKAMKTRSINQAYDLEKKLSEGDFSSKEKPTPVTLDKEAQKLEAEAQRAKQNFQIALIRDRLENRTRIEKMQDTLVRWRRGFLLSGPITLAKLTGAAMLRIVTTPLEELTGAALGKLVPSLMERAPRQGGFSAAAEAKAITSGIMDGMKDAAQKLRLGKSDLDTLFGRGSTGRITEADVIPQSFIDFFGHIHAALKAPVERSEFARSLQKRMEFAIKAGEDVSDPMIQTQLSVAAFKDAKRAIFMQDNIVTKGFNAALGTLENAKSGGERSAVGKGIATTLRVLLPIVKVPTNIVAEAMEYTVGSVTGSVKLAKAFRDGMENLTPDQADVIARQLKKGVLGGAVLALGYFNRNNLGGFYQQGEKRPKSDVQPGAARVGGLDIGKSLIHSSLMEAAQLGATVGRIQDSKVKGHHPQLSDAIGESLLGLAEEIPFIRTPLELSKLFDNRTRAYAEGELVKGLVVPQALSGTATLLDRDAKGNPIVRKPKTVLQHVETGIPGLREKVPARR